MFDQRFFMIEQMKDRFNLYPERFAADSANGPPRWLAEEQEIEPHAAVVDKSERTDGTFSRGDFSFNRESPYEYPLAGLETGIRWICQPAA